MNLKNLKAAIIKKIRQIVGKSAKHRHRKTEIPLVKWETKGMSQTLKVDFHGAVRLVTQSLSAAELSHVWICPPESEIEKCAREIMDRKLQAELQADLERLSA